MAKNKDKRFLLDVSPSNFFILPDGIKIKNPLELADSLRIMPDKVFRHHVNLHKNDFSEWIRDIIKDNELAGSVFKAKNKNEMIKLIERRIFEVKEKSSLKSVKTKRYLSSIERILEKEREINFREKKIQEIEEKIEKKLNDIYNEKSGKKQENIFFSKDFIQGIVVGILLIILIFIIYWKFFL